MGWSRSSARDTALPASTSTILLRAVENAEYPSGRPAVTSHTVAIVVLGARVHPDGRLSGALLRRVQTAALAWRQNVATLVVCSGGKSWNGHVEAVVMRDALEALGVPGACILLETSSLSTAENARETSILLRREGIGRVVLVTNGWHLPRALADFRLCGVQAAPLAAHSAPMTVAQSVMRRLFERACRVLDRARLTRSLAL